MFDFNNFSKIFNKPLSYEEYVQQAKKKCQRLKDELAEFGEGDHDYSMEVTKEELGLDDELINSLLEDYVVQIISTMPQFRKLAKELQKELKKGRQPDFQPLRDLAHKNLGVARNLRIKDAQKILSVIMKKEDAEAILECLEFLESCAIMLKPEVAYKVYRS